MPTILVVDDDRDFREALEEGLSVLGFQVFAAESADEALQIVEAQHVDVIVSDVRMPGDGATLPRRLQQIDGAPPVILMTAFDEPGIRERVLWDGAFAYLQKPIALGHLRRAIDLAIAQRV
jgi:CheY-like chemotaxis protein